MGRIVGVSTFLRPVVIFALGLSSVSGFAAVLPPDTKAVAKVAAGDIREAKASWWGFDPLDSTRALQTALNSAATTVVIDRMESPWMVGPIRLPGDKVVVFAEGVVVEAKRGAFLGKSDCLFLAKGRKNLVLKGTGATLRMHKADYHRAPYEPAEWRHILSLRGCRNVTIEGLILAESGGDGIYLGRGAEGDTNHDVTIRDVVCDGNNRQGISVITAENLLIENCVFRNTSGTAPEAGIDFEPNNAQERLVNCVLRNCRSENNGGHGYLLYMGQMHRESAPVSIRFENCTSFANGRLSTYVGLANREGRHCVSGTIEYVGCRFVRDQGGGVHVRGSEADGCGVHLRHCEVERPGATLDSPSPITIEGPRRMDVDVGNVTINDCRVATKIQCRPLDLIASPLARVRKFNGSIRSVWPGGEERHTLDAAQLEAWFPGRAKLAEVPPMEFDWRALRPVSDAGKGADRWPDMRLRGRALFLGWGEKGQPIELVLRLGTVGRRDLSPGVMTLFSANGADTVVKPEVRDGIASYSHTPKWSGPLRFDWVGDSKGTVQPIRCNAPIAVSAERGMRLFRSRPTLYFRVSRGRERFAILVAGAGTAETVKATIRDAKGEVAATRDNIGAPWVFVLERESSDQDETWSLTLETASKGILEDVEISTLGVTPLFAPTPTSGVREP